MPNHYKLLYKTLHYARTNKHPKWNAEKQFSYDMMILELERPVDFSNTNFSHIRPACLPTEDVPANEEVINYSQVIKEV